MRYLLICALCALFLSEQVTAQTPGLDLGIGAGVSIYQGDLSPHWIGAYNRPGPSLQVMGEYAFHPAFAIRANYSYSSISDNEENYTSGVHRVRKLNSKSTIHELSAQFVINPYFNNREEEPGNFRPYFFGGVGIGFLNIARDWSKFDYAFPHWQTWVLPGLKQDSMAAMPKSAVLLPVGVGFRYQVSYNLALYTEFTKRLARTEYLDGFSKVANPKEEDGFASVVIGLSFRLSDLGGGGGGYGGYGGYGNGGGGGKGRGWRNRGRTDCPVNVW